MANLKNRDFLIFILMMAAAIALHGAAIRNMTLDEVISRSDCVVYGRVSENRSYWDAATQTIWTQTEIQVLDVPKGKVTGLVLIAEPGGIIGNLGHLFPGVPRFEPQREVVVFLYSAGGGAYRVTGLRQGYYRVGTERASKAKVALPSIEAREWVLGGDRQLNLPQLRAPEMGQRLDTFLQRIRTAAAK